MEARKITFKEAWDSSVFFFVDDEIEDEIDIQVEALLHIASDPRISEKAEISPKDIANFLVEQEYALDVILKDIELSEEKFLRIVSLLRKLGRISEGFDSNAKEWSISKIKLKIKSDHNFANTIADLLVDGKRDKELAPYIPRYYFDALNYREIKGSSIAARRIRYKSSLIGTYGAKKGYKVEATIRGALERIHFSHGVNYAKGNSLLIQTDLDFAIPNLEDPWVVIMSSFQETTASGQTTKAKDMRAVYEAVNHLNYRSTRTNEKRVFVNFVDGGGWLARKRDFERLVDQCHYFINLHYLSMLESIILQHIPKKYFNPVDR